MYVHLKIIGFLLIVLALLHFIFPKYFKWETDLKPLSLINKEMMVIHTFFIAFTVFLMGILCLIETTAIINSSLGKTIILGFGVFWFVRLIIQFFGYSSQLWKGKTLETIAHIAFSCLWVYFTSVFFMIGFGN